MKFEGTERYVATEDLRMAVTTGEIKKVNHFRENALNQLIRVAYSCVFGSV